MGYLEGIVGEREGYQPLIILALDRDTVGTASSPAEIVFIALTI